MSDPDAIPTRPDTQRPKRPSTLTRFAKRYRAVLLLLGTACALTSAAVMRFAPAAVVEAHTRDIAELKAGQRYAEEDAHWTREALWRLSIALHVQVPPPPSHQGPDGGAKEIP